LQFADGKRTITLVNLFNAIKTIFSDRHHATSACIHTNNLLQQEPENVMKNHITRFLPITTGLAMQFLVLALIVANQPQNPMDPNPLLSNNLLLDIFGPFSLSNITLSLLK